MKWINPTIHLLAETKLNNEGVQGFLDAIGVPDWDTNAPSDTEKLIEIAGKTCYMSFDTSLNKNLTKVRKGQNEEYIQNGLIKVNHGSVLEHGCVTLALCGVSRILTHELIRHRAGCAYSELSGRYVRIEQIEAFKPKKINDKALTKMRFTMEQIQTLYNYVQQLAFAETSGDFTEKKEITSAIRRILPQGIATNIIFTANHRALRHIIDMRTSSHAEEEIQVVFTEVLKIMKQRFPNIYKDME